MAILLVIVLVLVAVALLPSWPYSRNWGYGPFAGGVAVLVLAAVVALVVAT